jgi:hypothetical protein
MSAGAVAETHVSPLDSASSSPSRRPKTPPPAAPSKRPPSPGASTLATSRAESVASQAPPPPSPTAPAATHSRPATPASAASGPPPPVLSSANRTGGGAKSPPPGLFIVPSGRPLAPSQASVDAAPEPTPQRLATVSPKKAPPPPRTPPPSDLVASLAGTPSAGSALSPSQRGSSASPRKAPPPPPPSASVQPGSEPGSVIVSGRRGSGATVALSPPPSFRDERLALLRHLKETPVVASSATSTVHDSLGASYSRADLPVASISAAAAAAAAPAASPLSFKSAMVGRAPPPPTSRPGTPPSTSSAATVAAAPPSERQQHAATRAISTSVVGDEAAAAGGSGGVGDVATQRLLAAQRARLELAAAEANQRSELAQHAAELLGELRAETWRAALALERSRADAGMSVTDGSIDALVAELNAALGQSTHAADRLQETYDVLERMAAELSDSRSLTLQVQAELLHAREQHAASVERLRLEFDLERDTWLGQAEAQFMRRVRKLASRVASQEQELIELRGAIGALRAVCAGPGGSELALRIVEDALSADPVLARTASAATSAVSHAVPRAESVGRGSVAGYATPLETTTMTTGFGGGATLAGAAPESAPTRGSGTRRLFETHVLDPNSATVRRLIEKGYLSPP